jgi:predicted Co/Zn/Cd cation transporter (cation efflux family)
MEVRRCEKLAGANCKPLFLEFWVVESVKMEHMTLQGDPTLTIYVSIMIIKLTYTTARLNKCILLI